MCIRDRLSGLTTRVLDLEEKPDHPPDLGRDCYDAIVVFFYLHRPLFPVLMDALKPNGILIYETFSIENYFRHQHPRRWEFCLAQNELLRLTAPLRVLHYDEGEHDGGHGSGPCYTCLLYTSLEVETTTDPGFFIPAHGVLRMPRTVPRIDNAVPREIRRFEPGKCLGPFIS